ncbi:unnamed protein product [Prunus armeniaca]|uniref:Uncharacterized protein n=1 Tax=Prunus armeniaca TaxID=36596 RepID=A0A6J5TJ58_PRUAR|nr:unnamed protein product [Prunus armeniaca]CAB4294514.1 unnamed protein product [Prunus armeniaca]
MAMNLMIDKPHTASNVDQTGDGIWNQGYIMHSVNISIGMLAKDTQLFFLLLLMCKFMFVMYLMGRL